MQEYVKISTDKQTTELLKQVSEEIEVAIESAIGSSIAECFNNIGLQGKLPAVITDQNEFPNSMERLKEQLIKISAKVEKVSELNLSQTTTINEENRNKLIEEIVNLFKLNNKHDETLTNIHLLQNEIKKNSEPILEIKERVISNFEGISENLKEIKIITSESSKAFNVVSDELATIKEQITLNNNDIQKSINLIISKQDSCMEKIKTIETFQNKPWYKKIII